MSTTTEREHARLVKSLAETTAATGYLTLWRIVRTLPETRARALFDSVADRFYTRDSPKTQRLRENLRRLVPAEDLEETVHAGVRSYLRYWCESFRLPSWETEDLVARTRLRDKHLLDEVVASGRGIVVPLPHLANWDWAGAWACQQVMPLMTVAERLRPERLYDEFVRYRESLGMHVLPLTGGEPPMARLEDWARAGGLICLLGDRDLSRNGLVVDFLGEKAKLPVGPAVLAMRTGAALLPVTLRYVDNDMELRFHPEVPRGDVAEMTQQVADRLSTGIADSPQDWHMMQRVFVADLDPSRAP